MIPFAISSKHEFFGIKLTKYVQDFYAEKYKLLMREIKDDLNRELCCVNGLEHKSIMMLTVLKITYRFNAIPVKTPPGTSGVINGLLLQFV